jgi:hypothetical protein
VKVIWRILQRYYEARARRSARAADAFRLAAEKFFQRIKGGAA